MNAVRTLVLTASLVACSGSGEKSVSVVAPPITRPNTVTIDQAQAGLVTETFPNSLLTATGTAKDGQGAVLTAGFSWTIDGVAVSTERSFSKVLSPGTYALCLEIGAVKSCQSVTVVAPKPMTGSAFLATETNTPTTNPQLVACSWKSSETNCVDMDASMNYSIVSADFLADTSYIFIRCKTAGCGWKPSIALAARRDSLLMKNVVLVRDLWTIQCGTWANRSVPLSLEKAYASALGNLSFLLRADVNSIGYNYNFQTWKSDDFPIPIALDRDSTEKAFLPGDSTIIMNSTETLNQNFGSLCFLGKPLFRTASLIDIRPVNRNGRRSYDAGIGIRLSNAGENLGGGVSNGTNLAGGIVFLGFNPQSNSTAHLVIRHELVHTLGFGHASGRLSWQPGLMTDSTGLRTTDPLAGVLIPEEVAHMQAFYRVREIALLRNACGMACIHQGERLSLGLPLQRVFGGSLGAPTQFTGRLSNAGGLPALFP